VGECLRLTFGCAVRACARGADRRRHPFEDWIEGAIALLDEMDGDDERELDRAEDGA